MVGSTGKKVHFVSLGCPKNLVDGEIMLGHLMNSGYSVTENSDDADTIVVNTCGFIEDAKRESLSKILEMSELRKEGKLKQLVVAGCLTQRYKDDLVEGLPEADLFIGSGEFQNIAEILRKHEDGETKKTFFNLPTYLQEETTPRVNSQPGYRAYLKISGRLSEALRVLCHSENPWQHSIPSNSRNHQRSETSGRWRSP